MATRVPLAPVPGRPWRTPRTRGSRKHKMEAQPEGVPLPKKRLTEDAMEDPPAWAPATDAATDTPGASPPRTPAETPLWEEMEDASLAEEEEEDAARQRLREIEDRIIDEDEEEEEGGEAAPAERSGLPTLVLSEALRTGLRGDLDGGLPRRILEAMSRPSMELVLWKPLPAFLGGSAKTDPGTRRRRPFAPQLTPERTPTHPPPPPPPAAALYGNAGPAEEEMEL